MFKRFMESSETFISCDAWVNLLHNQQHTNELKNNETICISRFSERNKRLFKEKMSMIQKIILIT